MKSISIVTPCFNEEGGIRECYETVRDLFQRELPEYRREHIFCDNASTDGTVDILRELAAADPNIRVIVNSRNFGILNNTYNGVMSASGDATVLFLPADLQDPPDLIPEFVRLWEQGYEVVFGIRAQRQEGFFWRHARHIYYRIISRLSYVEYPSDVGDFQLIDRKVLEAMKSFEDAQPFMRMMTFECGFRSIGVPYTWRRRKTGASKNYLRHLVDQGMLGLISFSTIPIRLCSLLGFLVACVSLLYAFVIFGLGLFISDLAVRGIPTIIVAIFFFAGVQLIFLGLVGEYILAIYNQVRNRPHVIERERINF
tara:strand:+ start:116 stop:1051 length:936 start_codon:yes stop_codon:yes gene_type:complete